MQDNLSTISGTTLARALLGSSFIFPGPGEDTSRRSSRYRSGMTTLTRQDSATLPRSDDPLIYSPWHDIKRSDDGIPPVPPVPSDAELLVLESRADGRRSHNKMPGLEGADATGMYKMPDQVVPETPPTSGLEPKSYLSPSSFSMPNHPYSASPGDKSFYSQPHSVPTTASLYPSTPEFSPPASSAASSGHELDNVLDYYQFASNWELHADHPGRPAFSPIMEETRSEISSSTTASPQGKSRQRRGNASSPLTPSSSRVDSGFRLSRNGRTLPIGDSPRSHSGSSVPVIFKMAGPSRLSSAPRKRSSSSATDGETSRTTADQLSTYSASSGNSHTDQHPSRPFLPGPNRSGSAPSPITVVRDAKGFNISLSPNEESQSEPESANLPEPENTGSAQTFPETPRAFSPLWSPPPGGNAGSQASISGIAVSITSLDLGRAPSTSSRRELGNSNGSQLTPLIEDPPSPASASVYHADIDASASSVYPSTPGSASSSREQGASTFGPVTLNALSSTREQEPSTLDPETLRALIADSQNIETSPPVSPKTTAPPLPQQSSLVRSATVASSSSHPVPEQGTQPDAPQHVRNSMAKLPIPANDDTTPPASSTASLPLQFSTPTPIPANPPPSVGDRSMSYFHSETTQHPEMQDSGTYYSAPPPSYDAVVASSQEVTPSSSQIFTPVGTRSAEETASRRLTRSRPPLPAGPRRPSGGIVSMGGRSRIGSETRTRTRNGSISSIASSYRVPQYGSTPRFRPPEPKWKGLTMDAAKWTFTSSELQGLVSQSIRQSAESSSIRLLHPTVLNNELPAEISHLQAERTDLTTRYKVLTRKRNALLGNLSSQSELREESHDTSGTSTRTVEELGTACATLDTLAEDLLSNAEQIAQLTSLREIHSYSALAMALRKLNGSFVKQVADNQKLRDRINALEAEKEEAWKQAESVANDFDALAEQVPEDVLPESAKSVPLSRRVSRRKSRYGAETQLRSSSSTRNQRFSASSGNAASLSARSTYYGESSVPPVPPIPRARGARLGIVTNHSSMRESTVTQSDLSTHENSAMYHAQQELYDMLGISTSRARRHRSFSGGRDSPSVPPTPPGEESDSAVFVRPKRPSSLPGSASLNDMYDSASADQHAILQTLGIMTSTEH